jgi:hypothetical protein
MQLGRLYSGGGWKEACTASCPGNTPCGIVVLNVITLVVVVPTITSNTPPINNCKNVPKNL